MDSEIKKLRKRIKELEQENEELKFPDPFRGPKPWSTKDLEPYPEGDD